MATICGASVFGVAGSADALARLCSFAATTGALSAAGAGGSTWRLIGEATPFAEVQFSMVPSRLM
ncbi:hypothetical protein ASB57_05785 [Bordetella sp. N]|nr:hypothetical protein ASB57_05785 [Bordetella sp. N]